MKPVDIPIRNFTARINMLWDEQWFLLSSGDFKNDDYNTMTVSWGFFGILWHRPCAIVAVRPQRYTFEFIEKNDDFTLCAFPENYHDDLNILGSRSGRDEDKIGLTDLHPCAAKVVSSPAFSEAELVVECKKIYSDDFDPAHFIDPTIEENYPQKDYHRFYIGEVVKISGIEKYRSA